MTPAKQQQLLQNQSSLARKVYEAVPTREPWAASQIRAALQGNYSMPTITGVLADLKSQGLVKEVSRLRFIQVEVKETIGDKLREMNIGGATKHSVHFDPEDHREAQSQFALRQETADPEVYADRPSEDPTLVSFHEQAAFIQKSADPSDAEAIARALTVVEEDVKARAGKPASAFDKLFELSQKLRSAAAAHHSAIADLADGIEALAVEVGAEREADAERIEQLRKVKAALNALGDL